MRRHRAFTTHFRNRMFQKIIIVLLALVVNFCGTANAQSDAMAKIRARLHQDKARIFSGALENPRGETLEVAGPRAHFTGKFVNRGTFKTTDTTVTFHGSYTEMGSYVSDPSVNFFTDLIIGPGGTHTGGVGDKFIVSGNFLNGSLQKNTWATGSAELYFSGGAAPHSVSLASADVGPDFAGYVNNFAWGILRIGPGQSLTLSDGNASAGGALYTDQLLLAGGIPQIASITGNGFNIYYNQFNAANAYLGGLAYPLTGGGAIIPIAASVKITATAWLPNGHFRFQCLGVPNRSHTIQASPDLIVPFAFLATVTAAADGTFQFEDMNAASYFQRYYRVVFP